LRRPAKFAGQEVFCVYPQRAMQATSQGPTGVFRKRTKLLKQGGYKLSTFDRVKKVVAEITAVSEDEINPLTSFGDDLGADSLTMVELVMALEEEFGIDISEEDAKKITTVGEAVSFIDKVAV